MRLLSVIMPVYNGQDLLDQAVASVLDQGPEDLELILVDDGSTDRTPTLCQRWQDRDSRVRWLRQENRGAGPARTFGLCHATGCYVAFLDHDDLWLPGFWNRAVEDLLRQGHDVYVWGYCMANLPLTRCAVRTIHTHLTTGGSGLHEPWGHHCGMFFRREHLLAHGIQYPGLRFSEDVQFCFQALAAAKTVQFCDRVLLVYRQRPGSITKTPIRAREDYLPILDSWAALAPWVYQHAADANQAMAFLQDTLLACVLGYLQTACGEGAPLNSLGPWLSGWEPLLPEKSHVTDAGELDLFRRHPRRFWLKYRIKTPWSNLKRRAYSLAPARSVMDRLVFLDPLPVPNPESL